MSLMRPSALTNTTLPEIARLIERNEVFAICGHVSPDGDCLGSALSLALALEQMGKRVHVLLAKNEVVEPSLAFLPGFDGLKPAVSFKDEVDVFIAVDAPTPKRLGDAYRVLREAAVSVVIDHHDAPETMSGLTYTVPESPSTSLLIWQLMKELDVLLTPDIATCAFTGLMTDTGRFQYQNATAIAFEYAAEMVRSGARPDFIATCVYQSRSLTSLHLESRVIDRLWVLNDGQAALSWVTLEDFRSCDARKHDGDDLIDIVRVVEGVRVACMLKEHDDEVRVSLRSKDDTDVSAIASEYGGGGHRAAAGFSLKCSLGEAIDTMRLRLDRLLGD